MKKTKCPNCQKTIELKKGSDLSNLVRCPECKTHIEVVRKDPPELDWADDQIRTSSARKNRTYEEY